MSVVDPIFGRTAVKVSCTASSARAESRMIDDAVRSINR